jgi:hypothetical protein
VLEDWIWHATLPLIAYLTLAIAGLTMPGNQRPSLFAVASTSLLLLFIGIHNAWDTVTYVTTTNMERRAAEVSQETAPQAPAPTPTPTPTPSPTPAPPA